MVSYKQEFTAENYTLRRLTSRGGIFAFGVLPLPAERVNEL